MLKIIVGLISMLCVSSYAQNVDFDGSGSKITFEKTDSADIPNPEPEKVGKAQPKEWTVMVFMNGKNNLADYILKDINEMEVYGPPAGMNIITESGRSNYTPPSYPDYPGGGYDDYDYWGGPVVPHPGWPNPYWGHIPPMMNKSGGSDPITTFTGIKRFLIQKDTDTAVINSPVVQTLETADMGDPNHLVEFVLWAKENYPARKYMLMVWNHGDGWKKKTILADLIKGISSDDESGNDISTVELGQALSQMGQLDIYASDACLMQMMEVVYELKDSAGIIVGSEETEPGDGWGYEFFLKRLHGSSLSAENVAKAAVEGYKESYAAKNKGITQSAVRTDQIDTLRYMIDTWAGVAMRTVDKTALKASINKSKGFESSGSRDLIDFLKIAAADSGNQYLISKAESIEKFLKKEVLIANATLTDSYDNANGLAIYLPGYNYDSKYDALKLSQVGIWDDFLKWV
ncbi:MAG: hypothetical protein COT17_06810, partial [Elusimicrobia bacterium CG08_land_8_20_14_0_20_51_18]